MNNEKRTVALIYGGRGHERDVSVMGANFAYSLIKDLYRIIPVYIAENGRWLVPSKNEICPAPCADFSHFHSVVLKSGRIAFPFYDGHKSCLIGEDGDKLSIDVAVPLLHGDFGEDGTVQGALSNAKLRYVGCDVYTGSLCMDKLYTKMLAEAVGIRVARYVRTDTGDNSDPCALISEAEGVLGYPMFVKPVRSGSSVGASVVNDRAELERALAEAAATGGGAIIEECVNVAAEAECAFYKTKNKEIVSNVGGILTDSGFYDYDSKYLDTSRVNVRTRLDLPGGTRERIREYTEVLAKLLRTRHLSRFDYFIDKSGEVIFNEVNTFPGFTEASLWPRLIEDSGLSPSDALRGLIEDAYAE
ncbi:MAG: D-alanine--D-alanine ligase [Clostridia bacterium]|nr:D-alanine--D-alanine ligase [Clostridia bacterium]